MGHYLMQFFTWGHLLPGPRQAASQMFCDLAEKVDEHLPDNEEKTACLRKLLEAKDCAVRAVIYK